MNWIGVLGRTARAIRNRCVLLAALCWQLRRIESVIYIPIILVAIGLNEVTAGVRDAEIVEASLHGLSITDAIGPWVRGGPSAIDGRGVQGSWGYAVWTLTSGRRLGNDTGDVASKYQPVLQARGR